MEIPNILCLLILNCFAIDAATRVERAAVCPRITDFVGRVKYRRKGTRAVFKCPKKFTRYGSKFATCQDDGTWSNEPPLCTKTGCVPLDPSQVPNLDMEVVNGALVKFSCLQDYVLIGATQAYCNGQDWSAPLPRCAAPHELTECDFEVDLCGWTQDDNEEQDWIRNVGPTPTGNTGPKHDHTLGDAGNGHYLFFETSNPTMTGHQAVLFSPVYTENISPICFDFWYHILGPEEAGHVGSLEVFVLDQSQFIDDDDVQPLFVKEGNQGDTWHRGDIFVDTQVEPFQIAIVATRALSYISDIAIDDVRLYNCSQQTSTLPSSTTTKISSITTQSTLSTRASTRQTPETSISTTNTTPLAKSTATTMKKISPTTLSNTEITTTVLHSESTEHLTKTTTKSTSKQPSPTTMTPTKKTESSTVTVAISSPSTSKTSKKSAIPSSSAVTKTSSQTSKVTRPSTTIKTSSAAPKTPVTSKSTSQKTSTKTSAKTRLTSTTSSTKPTRRSSTVTQPTSVASSPSTASTSKQTIVSSRLPGSQTTRTSSVTTSVSTTKATTTSVATKTSPSPTNIDTKTTSPKMSATTSKSTGTSLISAAKTSFSARPTTRPSSTDTTTTVEQTTNKLNRSTKSTVTDRTERTSATSSDTSKSTKAETTIKPTSDGKTKASKPTKRTNAITTKQPTNNNKTKDNSIPVSTGRSQHPEDETLKPLMIGLCVGIVAGLIIIGVIAYVCVRRRKFYTSRYEDELKPITNSASIQSLNNGHYYQDEEYESES